MPSPATSDPVYQTAPSAAAAAVLQQCADFIGELPEGVYGRPCPDMLDACIGQHLRHGLDHVRAILSGLGEGVIDYDHRERGVPVETDAGAARAAIGETLERLAELDEAAIARPVSVRVMLTSSGDTTDLPTTVGRELAFAAHHQTHHHAMMATIARSHGADVPRGFGMAPSTLNFENGKG